MLKKMVLSTLLVGLIGVLVVGAAARTWDRTGRAVEAQGYGHGQEQDRDAVDDCAEGEAGQGPGYGNDRASQNEAGDLGQGRGGQGSQGSQGKAGGSANDRQYPNYAENPPQEWLVYDGAVVQVPAEGLDLVIETSDGERLTVGTGPMYMDSQGFTLQAGELVQVHGYWENGEFKAAQLTCLSDGRTITLRDDNGRPLWAGRGRRGG